MGQNISVEELKKYYSALVFTYGAESDRRLNIPQEDPPLLSLSNKENPNATATEQEMEKLTAQSGGVISARSFVGWYNGHPEHHSLNPDLTRGDTAVIFGHGNVSLDIARMLLSPLELLKTTDISNTALTALKTSKIKKVILIGRRGPIEVSSHI